MRYSSCLRVERLLSYRLEAHISPQPHPRLFTTSIRSRLPQPSPSASPFGSGPAPPRLPKEEQETFEKLQRSSTGAFSTPRPSVVVNQSPHNSSPSSSKPSAQSQNTETSSKSENGDEKDRTIAAVNARVSAMGQGEELHPDVRRGAKPEFEGDTNPKTGEVGGPKNEPLRWGGDGDWSYNGRVTDF